MATQGKRATGKADLDAVDDTKLEMPIEVVGEHVKSGRKILADIDSATGAVQMRDKFKGYTDVVLAKIEEIRKWKEETDPNRGKGASLTPEQELEKTEKTIAVLDEEDEAIKEKMAGKTSELAEVLPGIDTSKVDPTVLALIQSQAATVNTLMDALAGKKEDEATANQSRSASLVEEGKREIRAYQKRLADDMRFARDNDDVPPPPKKNPRFGDKTPAYVEWLRKYRVEVYEDRYGVQEFDKVIMLKDGEGNLLQAKRDVSLRKVHSSAKIEEDPTLSSDQDWNA